MNPWIGLGLATLPALWVVLGWIDRLWVHHNEWCGVVYWRDVRTWKRWEWSTNRRVLSYTPKHWPGPSRGFAVKVRPWLPRGPIEKPPSMADDIHPIEVDPEERRHAYAALRRFGLPIPGGDR